MHMTLANWRIILILTKTISSRSQAQAINCMISPKRFIQRMTKIKWNKKCKFLKTIRAMKISIHTVKQMNQSQILYHYVTSALRRSKRNPSDRKVKKKWSLRARCTSYRDLHLKKLIQLWLSKIKNYKDKHSLLMILRVKVNRCQALKTEEWKILLQKVVELLANSHKWFSSAVLQIAEVITGTGIKLT